MIDIMIEEFGSGGDIIIRNNDVVTVNGFENQPYLAHFGGVTWMLNEILFEDNPNQYFTSRTETVLNETPLTSSGRILIEQAMAQDLEYLQEAVEGTKINVTCKIASTNKLDATVFIDSQEIAINWHPDSSYLNYRITQ